jgi:hypothetical protein
LSFSHVRNRMHIPTYIPTLFPNNLSILLSTLDIHAALVLEALETPNTNINLEHAAREFVNALAIRTAGATCAGDDEVFARETRARGLLRGDLYLSDDVTLGGDLENVASAVQSSPHVALFVDAVTIRHGVFAVTVILWHDEKGTLVRYRTRFGVKVELENRLGGAVGPVHLGVVFVPCRAVGDGDVA